MSVRTPAVCLFGLLALSCAPAAGPPAPSPCLHTLRVVDINVWSGLDYQGTLAMGEYETDARREARYRALLAQLRTLDPDVIGVHEANPLPDYVDRLAADLGYDAVQHMGLGGVRIGPVGLPWNLREGDAILARPSLALRAEGRRRLSGGYVGSFLAFHFTDATQALAASIAVNGRRVHVIATHWHAGEEPADSAWRAGEAEHTLTFIEAVAGTGPVILMGDFNATPAAPEVRRLLDAGFVDVHGVARGDAARPTWDPRRNRNIREHYLGAEPGAALPVLENTAAGAPKRIDLVLVRPGPRAEPAGSAAGPSALHVRDARVVLDSVVDGVHASDHFGVMAELTCHDSEAAGPTPRRLDTGPPRSEVSGRDTGRAGPTTPKKEDR